MHTCLDGGLVHEGDLGTPKCSEHVDHLDDVGANGLASDPGLVLLAVHPSLLDNAEANVNDVNIVHFEARAAGVRSSGEEAEDEGIKPVSRVPIGGHALPVCLAIIGHLLTILVDKPGSMKTILGLRRCRCWKKACTWDNMASRKTLVRAVFIITMSARVFLS
jgi:hypothetical protein